MNASASGLNASSTLLGDLLLRFFFGGTLVTTFALLGQAVKPRTFGGLFGAAPSVAIASIAVTFAQHGTAYVRDETRTMIVGSLAFAAYSLACVWVLKRNGRSAAVSTLAVWTVWLAAAGVGFFLLRATLS